MQFYYLIELQYLGFRFHGWQMQPEVKTVQEMTLKTLKWILPERKIKLLASGRTDAKVSVHQTFVELFVDEKITNLSEFLTEFNENLPADIRALSIRPTTKDFNIIQSIKTKEYHYYFSFGEKFHPFCAALMTNFLEDLDIELMKKAAKMFVGKRDFYSYVFRPTPTTITEGEILFCEIVENTELTASFFPEKSYVFKVKSAGFKRNQIRLMIGTLALLGKGEISWEYFLETLEGKNKITLTYIAPASGLQQYSVHFQ